jgi:hypothetical protein
MNASSEFRRLRTSIAIVAIFTAVTLFQGTGQAQITLVKLSTDTFTNSSSQHATEVEPDTFSFGNTIVTAFQVGRIFGGGSSDIGFATSTDAGNTWTNGFLPGITTFFDGGSFSAASDAAVAFDSAHGKWLVISLGLSANNSVLVSSSADGINWNNPVTADNKSSFADKTWIVCDNNPASPFFGHCYVEWDDAGLGDQEKMSTSTDGGQTWSAAIQVKNAFGLGGQPVVQTNGTVVVPFEGNGIQAFSSTNGGTSWGNVVTVSTISDHGVAGSLRTSPLPSADVDNIGTVYVAWQDCRFRTNCAENDIVFSSSTDGKTWSKVSRIPIDVTTSTDDHFIPGLAVDHNTGGSTAHLGVTYYFYPKANCSTATCKLAVGFISSQNAGVTWGAPLRLAGPMSLNWLPNTSSGLMVGDYISTSYTTGAFGVFAKANKKTGSTFDSAMYTTMTGLEALSVGEYSSANDRPIPGAHSDHGPRQYYDLDNTIPIPPSERD